MFQYPDQKTAAALRRMIRVHGPKGSDVASSSRFGTRDGEFATLSYHTPEQYDAIIDWLTEPTNDFRVMLAYAGETSTRVGVAFVPWKGC